MQLYVGRRLLESVSVEREPAADDERMFGRSEKMGYATRARMSTVVEYQCGREVGRHVKQNGGRRKQTSFLDQI